MGLIDCCFGRSDSRETRPPTYGLASSPHGQSSPNMCVSSTSKASKRNQDLGEAARTKCDGLQPSLATLQETSFVSQHTIATVLQLPIKPSLQQAVQEALGALDAEGLEGGIAQIASTVQELLGPSAIVRLYAVTSDDSDSQAHHAIQLAASAGRAVSGLRWAKESLPGRSFTLSPALGASSVHPPTATNIAKRDDPTRLLLERALSTRRPATFRLDSTAQSNSSGSTLAAAAGSSPPRDGSPGPLTFAAVPLAYGKRLMGALWVAVADVVVLDGSPPARDDSATASRSQAARSHALLASETALEQIGMSASMALALAAGGDFDYMAWLAACLRRLAICATLHTLVAGVCSAVSTHVRLRFHADAAVQSALVPEHDSHVAFMLYPETQAQPVASGQCATVARTVSARDMGLDEIRVQKGGSTRHNGSARQLRRAASQVLNTYVDPASSGGNLQRSLLAEEEENTADSSSLAVGAVEGTAAPQPRKLGMPGSYSPFRTTLGLGNRDAADGSVGRSAVRSMASATSLTSAPLLRMSAKAFHMSHTLLSRLVLSARAQQPPAQVPTGIVVMDTARHVADVRQPSRDVCMLIGAKHAISGSLGSAWQQGGVVGRVTSLDASTGSRAGASSLLLLAMEVADGGCMLGLYVAFPTLMPQPLLAAARDSCEQLLRQMILGVVRHKLASPELGPDLDTLRAGVPGSYVSVSRVRDHVDQLQLQLPVTQPQPAGESLALQQQSTAPHSTELEAQLARRMAAWSGCQPRSKSITDMRRGKDAPPPRGALMPPTTPTHRTPQTRSLTAETHAAAVSVGCLVSDVGPPGWDRDTVAEAAEVKDKAVGPPLSPAKTLPLSRGSWVGAPNTAGWASASASASAPMLQSAQAAGPESVGTLPMSNGGPQAIFGSIHTGSCNGGVPSGAADGSPAASSTVMLDSNADPVEPRFTQAALMTVHGVDDTWGMRGMMGALVDSVMTTLRASAAQQADESLIRAEIGFRAVEGLEELHLSDVLGHGANGVVLRGTLGTVPVAVKLMEMPDADYDALSTEITSDEALLVRSLTSMATSEGIMTRTTELAPAREHAALQGSQQQPPPQQQQQQQELQQQLLDESQRGRQQTESQQMRARRTMLRNATELAVMRLVSHVCIVQAFAVYDNVFMGKPAGGGDSIVLRRLDPKNPDTGGSPICTAIVQELCDRGSLADVLESRSFPARVHGGGPRGGGGGGGSASTSSRRTEIDMKGVYLTLMEIALALRHLHSRRLVHRDVKPANILLKSSPGDPRGWTCKLADFGFALVLDQQPEEGPRPMVGINSGSPSFCGSGNSNIAPATVGARSHHCWYTTQSQAGGTITHMAPEAMKKNSRIDASVDIYALGIIFWELTCGRGQRPFRRLDPAAIPSAVVAGMRPTFTGEVPAAYRRMAQACWAQEPHRRPRAADVVAFIKAQLAALG